VTRYLLDTNVISNVVKPEPSQDLLAWLGAQKDGDLFIASLTVAEIQRGILDKPPGRKRSALDTWFSGPDGPLALFAGRILPFDERAALHWARLTADGKAAGRPRSELDMIIASIAAVNDCVVVTDNEKAFVDITFVNPLRGNPQ
jgi:toxin FitB